MPSTVIVVASTPAGDQLVRRVQIRRGKSDLAAAPPAFHDLPVDVVVVAESAPASSMRPRSRDAEFACC